MKITWKTRYKKLHDYGQVPRKMLHNREGELPHESDGYARRLV